MAANKITAEKKKYEEQSMLHQREMEEQLRHALSEKDDMLAAKEEGKWVVGVVVEVVGVVGVVKVVGVEWWEWWELWLWWMGVMWLWCGCGGLLVGGGAVGLWWQLLVVFGGGGSCWLLIVFD